MFPLLGCLIIAHTAGLVCGIACGIAALSCMFTACMWSAHMHVHEWSGLCCDRKSVVLHVNVSGLHQSISVFTFVCAVNCFADDDEPFGYGQWHAPFHLSHQACLRMLCMGSRLIGTC